ncbi:MAG: hypothetical protein ACRELB_05500 [Polyangiaceae bacterium]
MNVAKVALEELAASLRDDLARGDQYVRELGKWTTNIPTGYEVHAAAVFLHHLFGAIEAFVERSVKTFDGKVPEGEGSHVQLLDWASKDVPGVRAAILPLDASVDELRRFRHRFRKRYDSDLDGAHVQRLAQSAVAAWPAIRGHLATFTAFVDDCIRAA